METVFRVEVLADNSGEWCGNLRTFKTHGEAEDYAGDLASRWTAVRAWRIVSVGDLPAAAVLASCEVQGCQRLHGHLGKHKAQDKKEGQ